MVLYSHFFKNFSQFVVIHRVKDFSINNEEEVDGFFFLKFPCFLHNPKKVGNLISGFSASLKPRLYIFKFSVQIFVKSSLQDFEYNLDSM